MAQVESNVVYAMYSGLALLMDVYRPERSNGYGVIFIPGSGWSAPQTYDASPLKASQGAYIPPLTRAGYTVFAVNHRAAPRFRYPGAVEDVQRAVRYVRFNAATYGINPARLGATGGSSGGHLVNMLGVVEGKCEPDDPDPINHESSRVQCVVARAAPVDFISMGGIGRGGVNQFVGMNLNRNGLPTSVEYKTHREASPLTYVSKESPPFLLIHGDLDSTVPFQQSELMEQALRQAGVPVELLRIEGGEHGPDFPGAKDPPDYFGAMVQWFDRYLRDSAVK